MMEHLSAISNTATISSRDLSSKPTVKITASPSLSIATESSNKKGSKREEKKKQKQQHESRSGPGDERVVHILAQDRSDSDNNPSSSSSSFPSPTSIAGAAILNPPKFAGGIGLRRDYYYYHSSSSDFSSGCSSISKKKTSTSNNIMVTLPTSLGQYFPPPPHQPPRGGSQVASLPSGLTGTKTKTTMSFSSGQSSLSLPPPPPRITSQHHHLTPTSSSTPPPQPVPCAPFSRRLSSSKDDDTPSPVSSSSALSSSSFLSSSLFCSVINENKNNYTSKKQVTFSHDTTSRTLTAIDSGSIATIGATTTSHIGRHDSDNNERITAAETCQSMTDEERLRMKPPAYDYQNTPGTKKKEKEKTTTNVNIKGTIDGKNATTATSSSSSSSNIRSLNSSGHKTITTDSNSCDNHHHHNRNIQTMQHDIMTSPHPQPHGDTSSSIHASASDSDLLKRVNTVCDSVYSYLKEFDSRNNNISTANTTSAGMKNKYSIPSSNPNNSRYPRRCTTENIIIQPESSSYHEDEKKLLFTHGSNNSIPIGYPRRHSTGVPSSRRRSTGSANHPIMTSVDANTTTATTKPLTVATKTQDDGNNPAKTLDWSDFSNRNNCSLLNDLDSLHSAVRGRPRDSRSSFPSSSHTIAATAASSSATAKLQQQYLRRASLNDSANITRRERRHIIHRSNSKSKDIIDNLTKQVKNDCRSSHGRSFARSSSEDGAAGTSGDGTRMSSLLTTKTLLQQLRTSLDTAAVARRGSNRSHKELLDHHKLGVSAATTTETSAPSSQEKLRSFSEDCGSEEVTEKEKKKVADDNDAVVVARRERCKGTKDCIPTRAAAGPRRKESACSSTESLSIADTSSDCESLISVLRSYQGGESKVGGGGCERKKGRKLLDVVGVVRHVHRRRGSSLSRNASRMLSTMDSPGKDNGDTSTMDNDSKASMVYDIPFDPITGKCHHHSTVQMAVRDSGNGDASLVSTASDLAVVFGWRIVRTTCPKCKYNY